MWNTKDSFVVGLLVCLPTPFRVIMLCREEQRGVLTPTIVNIRLHSFQVNNEHYLFPYPRLLLLFGLLCVVHVPLPIVVVFMQGRARRSVAPPFNHCWVSCLIFILSSLVWFLSLCDLLLLLVLFYCTRRSDKERQPLPSLVFVFVCFRWTSPLIITGFHLRPFVIGLLVY